MEAIREFNEYGQAHFSDRFRIDAGLAGQMYGFKAAEFFIKIRRSWPHAI